jgi:hypothetical protein
MLSVVSLKIGLLMSKVHLVIPDAHAHWEYSNERFEWLSKLIRDVKPDVLVNLGDGADMPSLCSYDKGRASYVGRTYRQDIQAFTDSQDRLFGPLRRSKKKLPRSVYLIGNHEERIGRALEVQPELRGAISYDDLELGEWYDSVVSYDGGTPGTINIDGVTYAHFFVSGVMGRPIGGEHPAYSIITKRLCSSTSGHTHTADYCIRTDGHGKRVIGCVAGVFQDYRADWAGVCNDIWWRGVIVKRNVEQGQYDIQWISLESLRKEYG